VREVGERLVRLQSTLAGGASPVARDDIRCDRQPATLATVGWRGQRSSTMVEALRDRTDRSLVCCRNPGPLSCRFSCRLALLDIAAMEPDAFLTDVQLVKSCFAKVVLSYLNLNQ
jgi:hypothetical protein